MKGARRPGDEPVRSAPGRGQRQRARSRRSTRNRDLDKLGLLKGVTTFNFHPHLPHYALTNGDTASVQVLSRQPIDMDRPHPFTAAGNTEFNCFIWMPPKDRRAGDILHGRLDHLHDPVRRNGQSGEFLAEPRADEVMRRGLPALALLGAGAAEAQKTDSVWIRNDGTGIPVGGTAVIWQYGGTAVRRYGGTGYGGTAVRRYGGRLRVNVVQTIGTVVLQSGMVPYERFDAWKVAHELALQVYAETDRWPVNESMDSQLRFVVLPSPPQPTSLKDLPSGGPASFGVTWTSPWVQSEVSYLLRFSRDRGILGRRGFWRWMISE